MTDTTTLEKSVRAIVDDAAREAQASGHDRATTFIRMCRKFGKIPGLSHFQAMEIAKKHWPGSYADYVRRQNAGERLPVLFERGGESYETRRARALARGGIIS